MAALHPTIASVHGHSVLNKMPLPQNKLLDCGPKSCDLTGSWPLVFLSTVVYHSQSHTGALELAYSTWLTQHAFHDI